MRLMTLRKTTAIRHSLVVDPFVDIYQKHKHFREKKTVIVIVSFDFSDFFFKDRLLINIVLTENGFEYDKFDLLILLNKFALQGSSYFNK